MSHDPDDMMNAIEQNEADITALLKRVKALEGTVEMLLGTTYVRRLREMEDRLEALTDFVPDRGVSLEHHPYIPVEQHRMGLKTQQWMKATTPPAVEQAVKDKVLESKYKDAPELSWHAMQGLPEQPLGTVVKVRRAYGRPGVKTASFDYYGYTGGRWAVLDLDE